MAYQNHNFLIVMGNIQLFEKVWWQTSLMMMIDDDGLWLLMMADVDLWWLGLFGDAWWWYMTIVLKNSDLGILPIFGPPRTWRIDAPQPPNSNEVTTMPIRMSPEISENICKNAFFRSIRSDAITHTLMVRSLSNSKCIF